MTSEQQEARRVIEFISQGITAGDPVEDVCRRIRKQMPHITVADIARIAEVHAEELDLDASEVDAQIEAAKRIVRILAETQQRSENAQLTVGEAYFLLTIWTQHGDKRAAELLGELDKAVVILGPFLNCGTDAQ